MSNCSNFGMVSRHAGLSATDGHSCFIFAVFDVCWCDKLCFCIYPFIIMNQQSAGHCQFISVVHGVCCCSKAVAGTRWQNLCPLLLQPTMLVSSESCRVKDLVKIATKIPQFAMLGMLICFSCEMDSFLALGSIYAEHAICYHPSVYHAGG